VTLSDEAKKRLTDVVSLQPTKNSELQDRWGMDSGSEIHQYLESELKEYYYRDENSLIRATPEAAELVGMASDEDVISVPALQACIVDVIAGPDAEPESVVSVLHEVRKTGSDLDPTVDEIRSALRKLQDRGLVDVVQKTVPTFRLAVERDTVAIEVID
jgi:chromosome condensin MukBEF MukE localization factor